MNGHILFYDVQITNETVHSHFFHHIKLVSLL